MRFTRATAVPTCPTILDSFAIPASLDPLAFLQGRFFTLITGLSAFIIGDVDTGTVVFEPGHTSLCFGDGLGRPCKCGNVVA